MIFKSTNRPIPKRRFWSFDTEDDTKGTMLQCSVTNGEEFFHFTDRRRTIEFLAALSAGSVVVATNLEYDLLNVFGANLDLLDFRFKSAGSVIVSARIKGTRVRFYDSLNHAPIGVAKMGAYLGLPKLKMDLSSWDYVDRDTLITHRFAVEFQRAYNELGAGFYATLPGTALDLFRRRFLPFPVRQPGPRALDFMYQGYHGGRTEVFRTDPQLGRLWYVDVNSLYPSRMMLDFPNPNTLRFRSDLPGKGYGFADCTVRVPEDCYIPPLPVRTDRLLFPVGRFRGTWTYPELQRLEEIGGAIVKVHRVLHFSSGCYPFAAYVDFLYPRKRAATNEIDRYTSKLLLNSLYGKFGERVRVVELIPLADVGPDETAIVYGNLAAVERGTSIPNHTNVAWSAYTTAYARLHLDAELTRIRAAGGILLYCDTDSIIYRSPRPLHANSEELGGWREEGRYSFGHFLAPKLYALEGDGKRTVHAKGVPRDAAVRYFDEGTATYSRPFRLRTILRKGLTGTLWGEFTKKRRTGYTKRRVLTSGETEPIIFRTGP